jgi:PAS domain S-box-containing protein
MLEGSLFERRLHAVLELAPIIHFAARADGTITLCEGGGLRALGFAPGEQVGQSLFEVYRDQPWILDGFRQALGGQMGSAVGHVRDVWFSIQYVPLRDDAGRVVEVVGMAHNVQELRESEARYQRLAAATFEAVAIHDQGVIIDANRALAQLFGYEVAELVGRDVLELAAPEYRGIILQYIKKGYEEPYEAVGVRKDGSTFPAEVRGRSIPSGGRTLRVTAIHDLSERMRLLDAEKSARATAEEALQLREEFISIASHELNTPLTTLRLQLGQLAACAEKGSATPEALAHVLQVSQRQTRRLSRLVAELLDVSRIRTGRLTLHPEEVDLVELTREALTHLQADLTRAGSPVELRADGPVRGRWDRLRIEQVVINLVTNALHYGLGQPVTLYVDGAERARLRVEDRGVGIPLEAQERIFERYERASSSRRGGLGLGLYIARQIVEAHGGTIRVDSAVGRGSLFTVELPL